MKTTLEFELNGEMKRVSTEPLRSLLDLLREDLELTGTKYGCGEGQCRACTVLIDGEPTVSCLTPASTVQGRSVETIESLETDGRLHPVQEAFIAEDAMQCGYCVPGMILNTVALLRKNQNPTDQQIVEALNGNLCRCCGYINMVDAVRRAAAAGKEVTQ